MTSFTYDIFKDVWMNNKKTFYMKVAWFYVLIPKPQPVFTCSKSTAETLEQVANYLQS